MNKKILYSILLLINIPTIILALPVPKGIRKPQTALIPKPKSNSTATKREFVPDYIG